MPEGLTRRALSGLRWGYLGFACRALAGFGSGIVLARLLGPKPFGQVAASMLVFGLATQLADGGFGSALVQAPELDEADIRSAFTFQLAISVALAGFCVLLGHLAGVALQDPLVGAIVRATGIAFLIKAFGQVSAALLKRRLEFRTLQIAQVVSSVAGYAFVGITAAVLGAGVWSLVAAQLAQSLLYSLLVFIHARHSVVPKWSVSSLPLARFGLKVTGLNILNWSIGNFDNAFVGRAFGSAALGLYSRAFNTVSGPSEAIVSTWQQVLFASCSRLGDRTEASQRAYLSSVSAVALIIFPLFWSIAACAPVVVAALYGERWAAMAPLLRPLALGITLNAVMAMAGPMLGAANQVKCEVKAQALTLVVATAAFCICIQYSAEAVAWAVLSVYLFRCIAATRPTLRLLRLEWADFFRALLGPITAGCITAGVVWGAGRLAAAYSVRASYALAGLSLTGIATISVLLLLAADHILSRELVLVLTQLAQSLPSSISKKLRAIHTKQGVRDTFPVESGEPLLAASSQTKGSQEGLIPVEASSANLSAFPTDVALTVVATIETSC